MSRVGSGTATGFSISNRELKDLRCELHERLEDAFGSISNRELKDNSLIPDLLLAGNIRASQIEN